VRFEDGAQYFRFHARGSYGRALGGVIGISGGVLPLPHLPNVAILNAPPDLHT